ncbi:cholecystokinin receptor type A-like [Ornithodoros turicata]|uniref:cholecystokinin receptor type A-like n=1 Tax=Ornithodoros turicata TaxID=34597 RepID=UPI0031390F07
MVRLIVPYSVIFLLAVLGNGLVIVTLAVHKKMRTVTNVFLLNLAISDLLLGVFCMPFTLAGVLLREFVFGDLMCRLIPYLQAVSVCVSAWTLVAMSVERYYAICHPLRSRRWQTLRHARRTITAVWSASLAVMLPIALLSHLQPIRGTGKMKCREDWGNALNEKLFTLFLDALLLVVPLLGMIVTYSSIAATLQRAMRNPDQGVISSLISVSLECSKGSLGRSGLKALTTTPAGDVDGFRFEEPPRWSIVSAHEGELMHSTSTAQEAGTKDATWVTGSRGMFRSPASAFTALPVCGARRFGGLHSGGSKLQEPDMVVVVLTQIFYVRELEKGPKSELEVRHSVRPTGDIGMENGAETEVHRGGEPRENNFVVVRGLHGLVLNDVTKLRVYQSIKMVSKDLRGNLISAVLEVRVNTYVSSLFPSTGPLVQPSRSESRRSFRSLSAATLSQDTIVSPTAPTQQIIRAHHRDQAGCLARKQRVIQMLFVVVVEFFVCWTPLYVVNTWSLFDPDSVYWGLGYQGISLLQLLAYASSCCNPITYCFMNRTFRRSFLQLFACPARHVAPPSPIESTKEQMIAAQMNDVRQ